MPEYIHSTRAQNAAALRARYKAATGMRATRLADALQALDDATLATAFEAKPNQVAALRARLKQTGDTAKAVKAAKGE